MCVYCTEDSACEHERDACAASRGVNCVDCGHTSSALPWHPPAFRGPGLRWSRPKPKAPAAKGVNDCRFLKEEDERLTCYNGFADKIPKLPR